MALTDAEEAVEHAQARQHAAAAELQDYAAALLNMFRDIIKMIRR